MATNVTVVSDRDRLYRWSELDSLPDQTVVAPVGDTSDQTPNRRIITRRTGNHVGFTDTVVAQVNEKFYEARDYIRFRVTRETCYVEFR